MNKLVPPPANGRLKVTIVDAAGLQPDAALDHVRRRADAKTFVWLDLCGGHETSGAEYLRHFGLAEPEIAWAIKFGQAGRILVERNQVIRASTWLAEPGLKLVEVHVLSSPAGIITVWNGDPASLDGVRQQFSERIPGLGEHPCHAAAVLLELLLSTIDQGISGIDERIQHLYHQVQTKPDSIDLAELGRTVEMARAIWLQFDRYASAARSATVGIEAVAGMAPEAARELNEYVEDVENIENRLHDRYQWATGIMQDFSAIIARRQSEQINRLTVVSIIFLPISFLTGFFGMNFDYLQRLTGGPVSFLTLGVALPAAMAAISVAWLRRRSLL